MDTLNYLISKLSSKNNPHVKKKCLKVLAKVSLHPATKGTFKRAIVQNPAAVAAIKEATQWRGVMDAVTGDQWNVEVREAAKECLDAVYSDAGEGHGGGMSQLQGQGMSGLGGGGGGVGMSGYGSHSGGGGGGYAGPMGGAPGTGVGSSSGSRMQGIGNPMYPDPRLSSGSGVTASTLGEMASAAGGVVMNMIKDPLARNVVVAAAPDAGRMGSYGGPSARPDPVSCCVVFVAFFLIVCFVCLRYV